MRANTKKRVSIIQQGHGRGCSSPLKWLKVLKGDLVFKKRDADQVTESKEDLVETVENQANYTIQDVLIPIPGTKVKFPDNEVKTWAPLIASSLPPTNTWAVPHMVNQALGEPASGGEWTLADSDPMLIKNPDPIFFPKIESGGIPTVGVLMIQRYIENQSGKQRERR